MTSSRRSGVYFDETLVAGNADYEEERIPLFIVQTSTAIEALDGIYTHYTGTDAFKTAVTGKGLTKTADYIDAILAEQGQTEFYVYSIKTDTATGFTDAIKNSAHLEDVTSVTYIEETKSASGNAITAKIAAIQAGLEDNYENGIFRIGYIIPFGTVDDAVTNAQSGTDEENCITSLTSILSGNGSGRICVTVPDANAGIVVGKCLATPYDENPGYQPVTTSPSASEYNFNNAQYLTLQNLGVLVLAREVNQGISTYRIDEGVSTGFKTDAKDGFIISRTIVDELLRQVKFEAQPYVKSKESESNRSSLNGDISAVLSSFIKDENIKTGSTLTVTDGGNNTFYVTGNVLPAGTVHTIEVGVTIA